jgi:hypothetical protein
MSLVLHKLQAQLSQLVPHMSLALHKLLEQRKLLEPSSQLQAQHK